MLKARLGLDVDGVLYPWEETARAAILDEFGIALDYSTHWDDIKNSITDPVWQWIWNKNGGLGRIFSIGEPFRGTFSATYKLSQIADIVIITSTPKDAIWERLSWLDRNGFDFSEIHITMQKKSLVPRCDVYIDDAPHNIEDLRQFKESTIIVWDRPWNQNVKCVGNVIRCREWGEVIWVVNGVSKRLHRNGDV